MSRRAKHINIRHGVVIPAYPNTTETRIKLAVVSKDFLWLGASRSQGVAWISGKKALRDLRDTLTMMLDGTLPLETTEPSSDTSEGKTKR